MTQLVFPNLNPDIYVGNVKLKNWAGWCLAYVEVAFGTPRLYGSAWRAWEDAKFRHFDNQFPVGVYFPVWFSHWGRYGTKLEYGNWGHVAIALVNPNGTMKIWSSPASEKAAPDTYGSIRQVEAVYSSAYVGWSEDVAGVQVISNNTQEEEMKIEDFASIILDVIADEPNYSTEKPEAFKGHVEWLKVETAKDWTAPYRWAEGIMHDSGVLNATDMRKHREDDDTAIQEAFDKGVASVTNECECKMQEHETQWKQVEDTHIKTREALVLDHTRVVEGKDAEIANLNKQLQLALQNAKDPARWTWREHLTEAFRKFFATEEVSKQQ